MIQRVRGTRDILPPESRLWVAVEAEALRDLRRLRLRRDPPAGARAHRAVRARGGRGHRHRRQGDVHLRRPQGPLADPATRGHRWGGSRLHRERAGAVAAAGPARLLGPMFRYEKMQAGRYRQFAQIGIELLGAATPAADVEVLLVLHTFLAGPRLRRPGDPAQQPRRRRGPAPVHRHLEGRAGAIPGGAVPRLPAALGRQPAAPARLQGAALPASSWPRRRRSRRWSASRRGEHVAAVERGLDRARHPGTAGAAAGARPRLLPAHGLRGGVAGAGRGRG